VEASENRYLQTSFVDDIVSWYLIYQQSRTEGGAMKTGIVNILQRMSFLAVMVCFLTAFSAYGADPETLDRLEAIIQQQQEQIAAQQKALEQLQGEGGGVEGSVRPAEVKASTDSPAAVKAEPQGQGQTLRPGQQGGAL
jgi:hypothetical protein